VLLSSAIAADASDYRQQILQAHIVAPVGQPVPFKQVKDVHCTIYMYNMHNIYERKLSSLFWCLEWSACSTNGDQVSVNRRRDAGRDSAVVLVSVETSTTGLSLL